MRLYLVRHGEAKSEDIDPQRGLTDKGRQDVERVGAFLKPLGLAVSQVRHSGKARAAQTAEILAQSLSAGQGMIGHEGLAPLDPVEPIAGQLTGMSDDLMLVGHLPFMGCLASFLIAGAESADAVAFQEASVVCLERDARSVWRVRWMVAPELL
ncbi:MAG: phosphohistidine phosphatase SixA [Pseudomonadota bacterium]